MNPDHPHGQSQAVYKASEKFSRENPEAVEMARIAVNRWGKNEVSLNQAIGEAILQAYELCRQRKPLPSPQKYQPSEAVSTSGRTYQRRTR